MKAHSELYAELRGRAEQTRDPQDQFACASILGGDFATDEDREEQMRWWHLAAAQGHIESAVELASCYAPCSIYGKHNHEEHVRWLRFAAERGHAKSILDLAVVLCRKNDPEGLVWLTEAENSGSSAALMFFADIYSRDMLGQRRDVKKAIEYCRKAAGMGNLDAQYKLGAMLFSGKMLQQNIPEAIMWWRSAAERHHLHARFSLGKAYVLGDGVPKDLVEGYAWLLQATSIDAARTLSHRIGQQMAFMDKARAKLVAARRTAVSLVAPKYGESGGYSLYGSFCDSLS